MICDVWGDGFDLLKCKDESIVDILKKQPSQDQIQQKAVKVAEQNFSGFTLGYLANLSEGQVIQACDKDDRMVAMLIYSRFVLPFKQQRLDEAREHHVVTPTPKHSVLQIPLSNSISMKVLNAKGRVVSKQFKDLRPDFALVTELPEGKCDLSGSQLFDSDWDDIISACDRMKPEFVLLSNTRLTSASAQQLERLLAKEWVKWVDVCGTTLASVDSKDSFSAMPLERFSKLVWVKKGWIEAGHWARVLSDCPDRVDTCKERHQTYYELIDGYDEQLLLQSDLYNSNVWDFYQPEERNTTTGYHSFYCIQSLTLLGTGGKQRQSLSKVRCRFQ